MKNLLLTSIIVTLVACAHAAIYSVPAQYTTIQSAIDDSNDGDIIVVSPGIYSQKLNTLGKAITVRSINPEDPNIVNNTIIDGGESGTCITCNSGEDANTVIKGFVITGGRGQSGGGIYCDGASPIIRNCVIRDNLASEGGGIFCRYGNPTVENSRFLNNSSTGMIGGGGIWCWNIVVTINNCSFIGNSALVAGGAIHNSGGEMTVSNCMFSDNSAFRGGGIHNSSDDFNVTITNCMFSGNITGYCGGGIDNRGPMTVTNCTIVNNSTKGEGGGIWDNWGNLLTNCILWDNNDIGGTDESAQIYTYVGTPDINYSCVQGWTGALGGTDNIGSDPCFADYANDDFHLTWNSPCINTGDPNMLYDPNNTDLDGNPRIVGSRVDMGCYELQFNTIPVAVAGPNQVVYVCSDDDLADVTLDGSGSYDDDNDILDYYWSWYIDSNLYEANGVSPTIQLPAGEHEIELVVDDGTELSKPNYCIVTVIEPLEVELMCRPPLLNTQSERGTITAMLCMPEEITTEDIDVNEPLFFIPGYVEPISYSVFERNARGQLRTWIKALFDVDDCIVHLSEGDNSITVVGKLNSGRCYYANSSIYVFRPRPFRFPRKLLK